MSMKSSFAEYRKFRQKLFAATSLLLVSAVLLVSTSYAWVIMSATPEVSSVATSIGANGALEIALGNNIEETKVGNSYTNIGVVNANRTWGNLVDLTPESYGLQAITLRPVFLNSAGGAVNTLHPFVRPIYGADGRVEHTYANDVFAGVFNGTAFVTSAEEYGVRGIGIADYSTPGMEGTFGPLSQRQEIFYNACNSLWSRMYSSYASLCTNSKDVLMAYCLNGTGMDAADFSLTVFAENVDAVVSAANEELRVSFTMLAAAETTSPENYFLAMDLLQEEYPDYESVQPLIDAAAQVAGAADLGKAIAELRTFQFAAEQLKTVIGSEDIDISDGYSKAEIEQTVGLIFDLEKTSFEENGDEKDYQYYSSVISGLFYNRYTEKWGSKWYWESDYDGSSVDDLTSLLLYKVEYQDDGSRVQSANDLYWRMHSISTSLMPTELDQAISSLYVSHWNFMDEYRSLAEEAEECKYRIESFETSVSGAERQLTSLTTEIEELEQELAAAAAADKAAIQEELTAKRTQQSNIRKNISSWRSEISSNETTLQGVEAQLERLQEGEIYGIDDSRLDAIRAAMTDTIETLRQYTVLSIAYFTCDGQVPDDAYHRMLDIADSSDYIHPRRAYQILLDYNAAPAYELAQMVEAYEKLEKELLFLNDYKDAAGTIGWIELEAELQRIFGTITHEFSFYHSYSYYYIDENGEQIEKQVSRSDQYHPEDAASPALVLQAIREKIDRCESNFSNLEETASDGKHSYSYSHSIEYGLPDTENQLWCEALGLLNTFCSSPEHSLSHYTSYSLAGELFYSSYYMHYTEGFWFDLSIGVGSEDNFNESGLTVRQTRLQTAQQNISYYQDQLITAAVDMDKGMVDLLMQLIAGQETVSLSAISDYLERLQEQLDCAEALMYQAALAMAASDYADDNAYRFAYSDRAPDDALGLISLLWQYDFDEMMLYVLAERMQVLQDQQTKLDQAVDMLENYQDPETDALTTEQIPAAEAVQLLQPVLDAATLTLYGYVEEEKDWSDHLGAVPPPVYFHTVLYEGFGSPSVQIDGRQATIQDSEPITFFGDVYLNVGQSLSGSLIALAKSSVETYAPPAEGLEAGDLKTHESIMTRKAYAIGEGEGLYTLSLCAVDTPYALITDLWSYTGNTAFISANQRLSEVYGYCIDLSIRTNAVGSDLMLRTLPAHRIYNGVDTTDEEILTEEAMGAGSYMEFATNDAGYSSDMAREYMACLRVVITDTNTGYIYGYGALDMAYADELDGKIKAPLRLYDKTTGLLMEGETQQYLCRLEKDLEKNLTVYVYLDGAKATGALASAYNEQSLHGVLNLQFTSNAELQPFVIKNIR